MAGGVPAPPAPHAAHIPDFLAPDAPADRLAILHGEAG